MGAPTIFEFRKWVRRLRHPGESKMSWGIWPPDVGDWYRRFEGAVAFLLKGRVSIFDQLLMISLDGDTSLDKEGHSAFETSGQTTQIRSTSSSSPTVITFSNCTWGIRIISLFEIMTLFWIFSSFFEPFKLTMLYKKMYIKRVD